MLLVLTTCRVHVHTIDCTCMYTPLTVHACTLYILNTHAHSLVPSCRAGIPGVPIGPAAPRATAGDGLGLH